MTPLVAVWVLSLSGAGLFFLGGHMFSRVWLARGNAQMFTSLSAELQATRAHLLEQEQTKQNLRTQQRALNSELSRSHAELHRVQNELVRARRESENPLSRTTIELQQMEHELTQLRHDCTEQAKALTQAERAASQSQAELARLSGRMIELSERSEAAKASAELERELASTKESLRARDAELTDLRAMRAKLQSVEGELAKAQTDVSRLADEARTLRSRAFKVSEPSPEAPTARIRPVDSKAHVLQALVDAEIKTGRAKTAVIADELGLLVAAGGVTDEYAESLAAVGTYLVDIGVKLQDMLPICTIAQVIVRDDQDLTVTARPLPLDQPGLSLVTMGADPSQPSASS
jgi:predicted RNase H-like nuclease (RuvC/YqgF family)